MTPSKPSFLVTSIGLLFVCFGGFQIFSTALASQALSGEVGLGQLLGVFATSVGVLVSLAGFGLIFRKNWARLSLMIFSLYWALQSTVGLGVMLLFMAVTAEKSGVAFSGLSLMALFGLAQAAGMSVVFYVLGKSEVVAEFKSDEFMVVPAAT